MHGSLANFEIVNVSREAMLIRDAGPWDLFPSITNDAERVVGRLARFFGLSDKRLFYLDSEEELFELIHDGDGRFLRFGSADAAELRRLDLFFSSSRT